MDENPENEGKEETIENIEQIRKKTYDFTEKIKKLQTRMWRTYFLIVVASAVMFALGIWLLINPLLSQNICFPECYIPAILGLAILAGLFLFHPIKRIQRLMGDTIQIIMVLDSFQTQRDLLLKTIDWNSSTSVIEAAKNINCATKECTKMIQGCFEEED